MAGSGGGEEAWDVGEEESKSVDLHFGVVLPSLLLLLLLLEFKGSETGTYILFMV